MSDSTSRNTHARDEPRCGTISVVLSCLLFCLFLALPLHAAEPVEIVVSGIEGDALKNVQESLVLPAGLVREGTVDRLWLERFAKQAEDKTRTALEPFGYYHPLVTVTVEPAGEEFRLLVRVVPGEPVRLTEVKVTVIGPGSEERRLDRLVARFPLNRGDVLLHQRYEEAKAALKITRPGARLPGCGIFTARNPRRTVRHNRHHRTGPGYG